VSSPSQADRASPLAAFLAAIQFLLISPAFIRRPFTAGEMGAGVGFYPLVGLILGGLLIGIDWLAGQVFPSLVRSALVLTAWVLLTGALHLDGFLDACDGLLGGFTPERRMEIMRDERVGAYALSGGILLLLVQFSALSALDGKRLAALLLAPVMGRWGIAMAVIIFPYARPSGLGRHIKDNARLPQGVLATGFAVVVLLVAAWLYNLWVIAVVLVVALITWLAVIRFTLKLISGLTGDIYGATNLLIETSVLLALVATQGLT
jgi:adenosylcobinamide-GDP ribazoletransferase